MPKVKANGITMNYEQQGTGEPLVLIPYLAADNACYAFQVADYAKQFTCISVDPRGAGETDKPAGAYSMELFADDVAAFMQAIGVERAHVSGLSLGAATGLWLAGKYPQRVKSLSLHRAGPRATRSSRSWSKAGAASPRRWAASRKWSSKASSPCASRRNCMRPSRTISTSSPHSCAAGRSSRSTPSSASRARSLPMMRWPSSRGSQAPTQITFGRHDLVCSTRFADAMKNGIKGSELVVFETCAHAPIYESVAEFNDKTLSFLKRHAG